jgi:hypothetical protein
MRVPMRCARADRISAETPAMMLNSPNTVASESGEGKQGEKEVSRYRPGAITAKRPGCVTARRDERIDREQDNKYADGDIGPCDRHDPDSDREEAPPEQGRGYRREHETLPS